MNFEKKVKMMGEIHNSLDQELLEYQNDANKIQDQSMTVKKLKEQLKAASRFTPAQRSQRP